MRTVTLLCLLLALAVPGARSARACSCLVPPPPREALDQADAVFVGTVAGIRREEGAYVVRFRVDHRLKGSADREVTVRTAESSAACGYYFRERKQYLVYAHATEEGLGVSLCSRTARVADAAEDLKALGIEDVAGSDLVGTSDGRCGGPGNGPAMQAMLFVVLGLWLQRRR
jgi:hypothetical protein